MRGLRGLGIQGLENPVFGAGCPGGGLMSTILSYNPIAYWPLDELSGTAAINYGSLGAAANGLYVGPTLAQIAAPGGGLAPLFNGLSNRVNAYSAALGAAWSGVVNTILVFSKVYNSGVWTDATTRALFRFAVDDAANYERIQRSTTNGRVAAYYGGGGVGEFVPADGQSSTDWQLHAITITDAGDELKYFINGVQIGVTQTGIGTWVGALSTTRCAIGATDSAGNQPWYGYLAHVAVLSSVLTQPQIATIYAAAGA